LAELIYKEESYKIMGACFEIYNEMASGFLEPVYQECLEIELSDRGIPFIPQRELLIRYKGRPLKQTYKPDFVCYDKVIIELKSVAQLADKHRAQVFHYLKATGMRLGLLINFGSYPKVESKRILL
jgi:GxxExxY protein